MLSFCPGLCPGNPTSDLSADQAYPCASCHSCPVTTRAAFPEASSVSDMAAWSQHVCTRLDFIAHRPPARSPLVMSLGMLQPSHCPASLPRRAHRGPVGHEVQSCAHMLEPCLGVMLGNLCNAAPSQQPQDSAALPEVQHICTRLDFIAHRPPAKPPCWACCSHLIAQHHQQAGLTEGLSTMKTSRVHTCWDHDWVSCMPEILCTAAPFEMLTGASSYSCSMLNATPENLTGGSSAPKPRRAHMSDSLCPAIMHTALPFCMRSCRQVA